MYPDGGVQFREQGKGRRPSCQANPLDGDGADLLGVRLGVVPEPGRRGASQLAMPSAAADSYASASAEEPQDAHASA
ncbi:MAG TPA: hypothetical protein VMR14_05245 [Streptosporangiaceae bacterium]|nr:hypothetical protein [Streptosporangiaceae bacterium]